MIQHCFSAQTYLKHLKLNPNPHFFPPETHYSKVGLGSSLAWGPKLEFNPPADCFKDLSVTTIQLLICFLLKILTYYT